MATRATRRRGEGIMQLQPSSLIALVALIVFVSFVSTVTASPKSTLPLSYYTVYYNSTKNTYSVQTGKDSAGVAWAAFAGHDTFLQCGWSYLSIETNGKYPDNIQAKGAGYIEGYLTKDMIWDYWQNVAAFFSTQPVQLPIGLVVYIVEQDVYIKQQIAANPNDIYWREVDIINNQLLGLYEAYNDVVDSEDRSISLEWFQIMNMDGDLEELMPKFGGTWNGLAVKSRNKLNQNGPKPQHCTALVRWTADGSELYTMHTTWSNYQEMNRIFKSYQWNTLLSFTKQGQVQPSKGVLFSSYPGTLSSVDDFYLLSNSITVTETTNGIYNTSLYNYISPYSLLSWMRVIIANRLATSGESWTNYFAKQNSGTYNNQWIVVDYNKFVPGKPLPDNNLIWIAEQIPGYVYREDVTNYIKVAGFWESFNIPFSEYIYNVSGFAALAAQYGNSYTHSMCPRATIFRRQAGSVESLEDAKKFIRYNNYKQDPLALGDAGNQISARYDLDTGSERSSFGGIDGKITSYQLAKKGIAHAQSGPSHDQLPYFDWSTANFPTAVHQGQPDAWNYDWVGFSFNSAWTLN